MESTATLQKLNLNMTNLVEEEARVSRKPAAGARERAAKEERIARGD